MFSTSWWRWQSQLQLSAVEGAASPACPEHHQAPDQHSQSRLSPVIPECSPWPWTAAPAAEECVSLPPGSPWAGVWRGFCCTPPAGPAEELFVPFKSTPAQLHAQGAATQSLVCTALLINCDFGTSLCIVFPQLSATCTTPVPAASPAPSGASSSESPPSGCGQCYSPPRKHRDQGWVCGGSWANKENGHG